MREKENRQFRILSALGIIFVVAGHLGYGLFDVGGLFPCYSFHVFIFLFVSGYFYREDAESDILGYVRRKCFTLLLPYFLWNLFYGILARIISGHPFFSQKLAAIGRGTYSVMMHHAAVFMLVKGVFLPVQPQDVLLCGLRQRAVFSRYQLCIFCRRDRGGKVDLPAGGNRRAASGRPGASGRLAASEQKRRRIFYKKGTEGGTERIQKH